MFIIFIWFICVYVLCGPFIQCWYFWNGRVGKRWIVKLYCHAYLLKYVSHVHSCAHTHIYTLYIIRKKALHSHWVSKSWCKKTENVEIFSHNGTKTISIKNVNVVHRLIDDERQNCIHSIWDREKEKKPAHIYMFHLCYREKIIGLCRRVPFHSVGCM